MSSSHADVSFNHSCLKVPVNPLNKLPKPIYERKNESRDSNDRNKSKKKLNFKTNTSFHETGQESSRQGKPQDVKRENVDSGSETFQSFINFYESIPDYRDINQLSDKDFYLKVEYYRQQQKSYLKMLGKTPPSAGDDKNRKEAQTGYQDEFDVYSKYVGDEHNPFEKDDTNYVTKSENKIKTRIARNHISSPQASSRYSDNSTESLADVKHAAEKQSCPEIHVENYGPLGSSSHNPGRKINSHHNNDFEKQEIKKCKERNPYSENTRDVHSASTAKHGTPTGDSSSSIIESMWDDFVIDDYAPKKDCLSSGSDSEENDFALYSKSLPSSPVFKHSKNVVWKEPNITVPRPFKMTEREDEDRFKHHMRCLLKENPSAEKDKENKIIKANPVPFTSQLPLFDTIMAQQELRRLREREMFLARRRADMRPFSFCGRERKKTCERIYRSSPELRDPDYVSPRPFRARPVPRGLFSPYVYERMFEDEFYRDLKKRIRAEEMLKASSLPPSMAARERIEQARKTIEEEVAREAASYRKKKERKIPDYGKYHEAQRKQLEARLEENITTSPQPFHLETEKRHRRKSSRFKSPDPSSASSPYGSHSSVRSKSLSRPNSSIGFPLNRNNLAAVLRIQSARQRLEDEINRKQEELRRLDEAKIKSKLMRRNPVWQSLRYSTAEDLMMRIEARREEERLRREEYDHFMELMFRRVRRIPTLFERQSEVSNKARCSQYNRQHKKRSLKSKQSHSDEESEYSFRSNSKASIEEIYNVSRSVSPTKMLKTRKLNPRRKKENVIEEEESEDAVVARHVEFNEEEVNNKEEKGSRDEGEKEENKDKRDSISDEEVPESIHASTDSKSSVEEKE